MPAISRIYIECGANRNSIWAWELIFLCTLESEIRSIHIWIATKRNEAHEPIYFLCNFLIIIAICNQTTHSYTYFVQNVIGLKLFFPLVNIEALCAFMFSTNHILQARKAKSYMKNSKMKNKCAHDPAHMFRVARQSHMHNNILQCLRVFGCKTLFFKAVKTFLIFLDSVEQL